MGRGGETGGGDGMVVLYNYFITRFEPSIFVLSDHSGSNRPTIAATQVQVATRELPFLSTARHVSHVSHPG